MEYPFRVRECPKCGTDMAELWPMLPMVKLFERTAGKEVYRNMLTGRVEGVPQLQARAIGNLSSAMFERGSFRMDHAAPREVEELGCQCRCGFSWMEVPLDQRKEAP